MDLAQEVADLAYSMLDLNHGVFTSRVPTRTLCLDGTSSTCKSSILAETGRRVSKVQHKVNVPNADTYLPSLLGYVASGINNQNRGDDYAFNDRSFLNPIEWRVLWRVMNQYERLYGHDSYDPVEHCPKFMLEVRKVFETLASSHYYQSLRSFVNCVVLIDSNVERCDELRTERGNRTDVERSAWSYYTALQNEMYRTLYPGACLDLKLFDAYDRSTVVSGLAILMISLLDKLAERNKNRGGTPVVPLAAVCRFPIDESHRNTDHTLANATTHVYRSLGRATSAFETKDNIQARMRELVPEYIDFTLQNEIESDEESDVDVAEEERGAFSRSVDQLKRKEIENGASCSDVKKFCGETVWWAHRQYNLSDDSD